MRICFKLKNYDFLQKLLQLVGLTFFNVRSTRPTYKYYAKKLVICYLPVLKMSQLYQYIFIKC